MAVRSRTRTAILQYILALWVALTLNFVLPRLVPGDPLEFVIGPELQTLTTAERARLTAELGLDGSLPSQYARYWSGVAVLDFGHSIRYGRPVRDLLVERLGWTLLLTLPALVLSTTIGVALGTLAAWRRHERGETVLLGSMLLVDSLPVFWIGLVLASVFAGVLGWLPPFGARPLFADGAVSMSVGVLERLVMPVATLTIGAVAHTFLVARASVLTAIGEDYVLVAEAKGLRERAILFRHVLPNALLPVYTTIGLSIGGLASGAVVVETVFGYPGLGRLAFEAVAARDYPLLQGAFVLIVLGVLGANAVVDLTYQWLDPRVDPPTHGASW